METTKWPEGKRRPRTRPRHTSMPRADARGSERPADMMGSADVAADALPSEDAEDKGVVTSSILGTWLLPGGPSQGCFCPRSSIRRYRRTGDQQTLGRPGPLVPSFCFFCSLICPSALRQTQKRQDMRAFRATVKSGRAMQAH